MKRWNSLNNRRPMYDQTAGVPNSPLHSKIDTVVRILIVLRILHYHKSADKLEQESGITIPKSSEPTMGMVMTLNHDDGETRSMEFHPVQPTLLLVGTTTGNVELWDISKKRTIAVRKFKIWDLRKFSKALVATLAREAGISVNHVTWSPDGTYFGAAYSQHLVCLYKYSLVGDDLQCYLEIDAHVGSVNGLAFSSTLEGLSIVTCGDDKAIKVWNASTGDMNSMIKHESPVLSVFIFQKGDVKYIISTSHGKETVWLYDDQHVEFVRDTSRLLDTKQTDDRKSSDNAKPICILDKRRLFSAVTSITGGINILATSMGMQMLSGIDDNISSAVRLKTGGDSSLGDVESQHGSTEESQCCTMRLPGALLTRNWPVSRLTYSHSGESLLALASNGVHSLWKWQKNDKNETEVPSMCRPPSGGVMINELNRGDNETR